MPHRRETFGTGTLTADMPNRSGGGQLDSAASHGMTRPDRTALLLLPALLTLPSCSCCR